MLYVISSILFLAGAALLFFCSFTKTVALGRTALGILLMVAGAATFGKAYVRDYVVAGKHASANIAASDQPASYARYFGETCKAHDMTIVDAGAEWCGYCRRMDRETFADPSVKAAIANDGFVKVTEEESPEVILALDVQGYPTTVFLDRQCKEVHRARGFRATGPFLDEVRTARRKLPH